ncbi:MAG: ChaN family lipoprotein [Pseudomonadota bacterium]
MTSLPLLLNHATWPYRLLCTFVLAATLSGCASIGVPSADDGIAHRVDRLLPADVLLIGEQHDAPAHHQIEREVVEALVQKQQLAALALEMAESGNGTAHLPADATESQVKTALSWNDKAWPWTDYGPAVMVAVRASVPVLGANLPRARMKDAMADVSLDAQLDAAALRVQQDAIRSGHCDLLPATQIGPMTRIQIARDREMAHTLAQARVPGRTVVLLSGAGHAVPAIGVPQHLPTDLRVRSVKLSSAPADGAAAAPDGTGFDAVWSTPPMPDKDHCAELRRTFGK